MNNEFRGHRSNRFNRSKFGQPGMYDVGCVWKEGMKRCS